MKFHRVICKDGAARLVLPDKRKLLQRLRTYYVLLPNVETLDALDERDALAFEPLRRVYRGRRRVVRDLIAELIESAGGVCPYCGQILAIRSLDHFLPQDDYPEFAVARANLVPICDGCNGSKGTKVRDAAGNRLVFHPYADAELDQLLACATAEWSHGIARFTIVANPALPEGLRSRVERHLGACGVQSQFARKAVEELRRWQALQRRASGYSEGELRERMLEDVGVNDELYGVNNWRSIAVRCILGDRACFRAVRDAHRGVA